MQFSTLPYVTFKTALPHNFLKKKKEREKNGVTLSFILRKVPAGVEVDLFQVWSCAVRFSLAIARLAALFDFVVSVNPLSLQRLWLHHLLSRVYVSILLTPPHQLPPPSVSIRRHFALRWSVIPPASSLFLLVASPLLLKKKTHPPKTISTAKKTKHQPPSVFLGQLQNEIQWD